MNKIDYTDWEDKDQLLVRVGGSHRTYNRQRDAFNAAGIPWKCVGCATLGSKFYNWVIPDTYEAVDLLRKVKGTIARKQWNHLKAAYWQE